MYSFFQFAANYARDKLISNINQKVIELKDILAGRVPRTYQNEPTVSKPEKRKNDNKINENVLDRRKSFRKVASTSLTDDCMKKAIEVTDQELLDKLESISPVTREVMQIIIMLVSLIIQLISYHMTKQ